jgi:hypothetical protein
LLLLLLLLLLLPQGACNAPLSIPTAAAEPRC